MTVNASGRFLVVCLNPTMQKTLVFESFMVNEVNRVVEERLDASGKGVNVARVLVQSGEDAVHLTHLGGDTRAEFERLCREDGVPLEVVACDTPIRMCTTAVDRAAHTTTEIVEPTKPVSTATEAALLNRYEMLLQGVSTVIFSGTAAPGYSVDLYARMTMAARDAGAFVIADYRGAMLKETLRNEPHHRPQVIKPNLREFAETFLTVGLTTVSEHADDPDTLREVRNQMETRAREGITTVLTRGANPVLAVDPVAPATLIECAPLALTPVNTIGCGDAFTAGLAAELAGGGILRDAIERGHAMAAMNAGQLKPGSIRPE